MAQQNSFEVLDPTATHSIATSGMAKRPGSLAGMKIGLMSNDKLNAGIFFTVVGAVHIAVGTTLFFVLPKDKPGKRDKAARPTITPVFAPGFSGLSVSGTF